jgi:hypothetical protein
MKRIKITIPVSMDETAAQWFFDNEVRMLLSYSISDFFDSKLVIICGVPDEKVTAFQTQFSKFVKS